MRWWGSKPQSVTAQYLDSVAYLLLHIYSSPSALQFLIPFLDHPFRFSLPPGPIPYLPPFFTCRRCSSLSLHSLLPPSISPRHGATVHLDSAPARRPPLIVCASLPCQAAQRSSSHELCLPSPFWFPPFLSLTCAQVPVGPRFLVYRGPFLPLPASINLTPAPPP